MLRPATPLTVLLFAAFVLLLLSTISTPVVKGIPLATFEGVDFGVFGYCKGSQCSGIRIGYTTHGLFGNPNNDGDFNLPSSARNSLSSLLIIHPVATLMTLICFLMSAASHLHSPSHSAKYLLGLLILLVPTLLVTLLAFLVDILLFVPHLQWGGWIVLAATILITISMVVTCAMRRTLVSRKARKRRIAENAEMNGENFYSRQNAAKAESPETINTEHGSPMVNGALGANSLPSFATFDPTVKEAGISEEDRLPSDGRSPPSTQGPGTVGTEDGSERYAGSGPPRGYGPRDEFGNPLPPSAAFGPQPPGLRRDPSDPRLRNQYSAGSMRSQGRVPPGYSGRGRGGYPPRGNFGRGGYGPRGPPPPRGYNGGGPPMGPPMGPMAAGAISSGIAGRGRGPPPGYPPYGPYSQDPSGPYGPPGGLRSRPTPAPAGYTSSPGPYGYSQREASPIDPVVREQSAPPPVPQMPPAAEMEGARGQIPGYGPGNRLRESDSDVQGMIGLQQIGLQQSRSAEPLKRRSNGSAVNAFNSQEPYVPVRAGWNQGAPPIDTDQPPVPVHNSPVELPAGGSNVGHLSPSPSRPRRVNSGDNYYEDVDPRFDESDPRILPRSVEVPAALTPGAGSYGAGGEYAQANNSYDDIQEGARSPAASEASHFTSVSQRGVNPDWRPPPGAMPMRKAVQQNRDILLGNNPDFEIPGSGSGRGRGGGRGGRMPGQIPGLGGQGRYPTADV